MHAGLIAEFPQKRPPILLQMQEEGAQARCWVYIISVMINSHQGKEEGLKPRFVREGTSRRKVGRETVSQKEVQKRGYGKKDMKKEDVKTYRFQLDQAPSYCIYRR
jgi:hypothetical protein